MQRIRKEYTTAPNMIRRIDLVKNVRTKHVPFLHKSATVWLTSHGIGVRLHTDRRSREVLLFLRKELKTFCADWADDQQVAGRSHWSDFYLPRFADGLEESKDPLRLEFTITFVEIASLRAKAY